MFPFLFIFLSSLDAQCVLPAQCKIKNVHVKHTIGTGVEKTDWEKGPKDPLPSRQMIIAIQVHTIYIFYSILHCCTLVDNFCVLVERSFNNIFFLHFFLIYRLHACLPYSCSICPFLFRVSTTMITIILSIKHSSSMLTNAAAGCVSYNIRAKMKEKNPYWI